MFVISEKCILFKNHDVTLSNVGSSPGILSIKVTNIRETAGLDGKKDMASNLIFRIVRPDGTELVNSPMSQINNHAFSLGKLSKHGTTRDSQTVNIKISLSESAGNSVQGDDIGFNIKYNLDQI